MRLLSRATFAVLVLILANTASAGFIEIGGSGSYKRSNIDGDTFDEIQSLTGSLAYYFTEASAIEISYTDGTNRRVVNTTSATSTQQNSHVTSMFYKIVGLDFIYTIGGREAPIRPYIKFGANYILSKRLLDQYSYDGTFFAPTIKEDSPGAVPSAGLGVKFSMTQSLSLKVGVDAWTSRSVNQQPVTVDYIGRVGISWLF